MFEILPRVEILNRFSLKNERLASTSPPPGVSNPYLIASGLLQRSVQRNTPVHVYYMYLFLQYFDTVGWVFWPVKTVSHITYTVLVGT